MAKARPILKAKVIRGKGACTVVLRVGRKTVALRFTDAASAAWVCKRLGVQRG